MPGVRQAVVLMHGEGAARELVGFYTVLPGRDPVAVEDDLERELAARLPRYMVPSRLIALDELPLTPNGKTDRARLLASLAPRAAAARSEELAPRNEMEEALVALWCEHLGVPDCGIEDDFFALGGHSLLATRVLFAVNARFGCRLRLTDLLRCPTVSRLAERVAAELASVPEPAAVLPLTLTAQAGGPTYEPCPAVSRRRARCLVASAESRAELPSVVPAPHLRHAPFALTEIQQAYWVGRQDAFELGNVATHIYLEFESRAARPRAPGARLATA